MGREDLIEEVGEAIEQGPGSAARATLYTGPRGSGKTVLLNAIEDRAKGLGWLVISETASPGFVDRITRQHLPRMLRDFDPRAVSRRMSGLNIPLGPLGSAGGSWNTLESHIVDAGLRNQIELLTELLVEHETGLLISLDEVHKNQIEEMRQLVTAVQHAFREDRQLAFIAAGLRSSISELLNDEVLTFLRRAERHHLGSVILDDVRRAIREPIQGAGRIVGDEALEVMANGTRGYPFLIQLVGSQTWRIHPSEIEVTVEDASIGVARALRRLGALVYEPALAQSSDIDKSFLLAMTGDDGPSKMSAIEERLGVSQSYSSQYRLRLIAAELIVPAGYGYVDFALPYLREYLREEAAAQYQ